MQSGGGGGGGGVKRPRDAQAAHASATMYASIPQAFPPAPPSAKSAYSQGKKFVCHAGEERWEDPTLADWNPNDFRIFVGDLGNEVTDDILRAAFSRYASLDRVRVVREKRSDKAKGYGFVSFTDPKDGLQALREVNGRYIGNRPCKLRKSKWEDRAKAVPVNANIKKVKL